MITIESTYGRLADLAGNVDLINSFIKEGRYEEADEIESDVERAHNLTIRDLGRNSIATGLVTLDSAPGMLENTVSEHIKIMSECGLVLPTQELVNNRDKITQVCSNAICTQLVEIRLIQHWQGSPDDAIWKKRWEDLNDDLPYILKEYADAHSTSVMVGGVSRGKSYNHAVLRLFPEDLPGTLKSKDSKPPDLSNEQLAIIAGHIMYFKGIHDFARRHI